LITQADSETIKKVSRGCELLSRNLLLYDSIMQAEI
jgi:hypothetical protein